MFFALRSLVGGTLFDQRTLNMVRQQLYESCFYCSRIISRLRHAHLRHPRHATGGGYDPATQGRSLSPTASAGMFGMGSHPKIC